uniref:ATP synthase complex subunit 8 n=1 Tax=Platambus maculatus TaxID=156969 RepID=A0A7G7CEI4_PLAMC|nr:ATP synthase F0 subunit 8 [Platambus maculatus]
MPQMAPMNWMFLYIFFSMTFMLFNFINYYMFIVNNNMNKINNKFNNKYLNWKW